MSRPRTLKPAYCHHRLSGRAFVKIDGHFTYLGDYGTQESRDAYDRVIGEWIARGRTTPVTEVDRETPGGGLTVLELVTAFIEWAQTYYSEPAIGTDGNPLLDSTGNPLRKPSGEFVNYRLALRPLAPGRSHLPSSIFIVRRLCGRAVSADQVW